MKHVKKCIKCQAIFRLIKLNIKELYVSGWKLPRGGHPCRPANVSPCRVRRGLAPPSEYALPGAPKRKGSQVASLSLSIVFSGQPASIVLEHLVHAFGIQDAFGPEVELFGGGFAELFLEVEVQDVLAEAFVDEALEHDLAA